MDILYFLPHHSNSRNDFRMAALLPQFCIPKQELYLVPKLLLGNAYYQTTTSTPSKTTSSPVSK
jgi:hypothetical protein